MSTTSVVLEILVIGITGVAWVSLLVGSIVGTELAGMATAFRDWCTLLPIVALGGCYTFGLFFDALVSRAFAGHNLNHEHFRLYWPHEEPKPFAMRTLIVARSPEAYRVIEQQYNQHRLARSLMIQFVLLGIAFECFCVARLENPGLPALVGAVLAVVLVYLSYRTWRASLDGFYYMLTTAYRSLVLGEPGRVSPREPGNGAAEG